jgi:hypothetical protein
MCNIADAVAWMDGGQLDGQRHEEMIMPLLHKKEMGLAGRLRLRGDRLV